MIGFLFVMAVLLYLASGIRKIKDSERGVWIRGMQRGSRALGPGFVFIAPFFMRLEHVSIAPFSVSLPPQSAITKDEIPIQLQAAIEANVINANLAVTKVRDWRIYLMSQLQDLIKEKLEELDFDRLDERFPDWVNSIRKELNDLAGQIGVEIQSLQIANLSPRTKPV